MARSGINRAKMARFPWFPVKVRRSTPRPMDQCTRERDAWVKWDTPGRRLSKGQLRHTRSWKRVPSVQEASELLDDCMWREYLPRSDNIDIRLLAQGSTNILFLVTCPDWDMETAILRIAMPYDPWYQLESEVASMMMAAVCGIPVPRCFMFDSSAENPLGLEWMLIQKFDAGSLETVYYRKLRSGNPGFFEPCSTSGHQVLEEVARYSRRLENIRFQHIGSLYMNWDKGNFYVGPIVEDVFLTEDTYRYSEGYRGPYRSYEKYLERLAMVKTQAASARSSKSAECNHAQAFPMAIAGTSDRLLTTINKVYHAGAPRGDCPFHGSFAYFQHEDLHAGNVLVGDPGEELTVKAIVDWGGCRVAPHFMRRSQGVPIINEVFAAQGFLLNLESFDTWQSLGKCFAIRSIVRELEPEEKHVSVAAMVLHLWYRQVKKMDPRAPLDPEPVRALEVFVNHFVQCGFKETRTWKTFMAALNGPEDDDMVRDVY